MRHVRTTFVMALSTLLLVSISSAQRAANTSVPNLIRYSGTLKDAQGAPLPASTAVGVTFSIYKQQDGGGSVWMETQNVTPDNNGQYNVILGSTTATGLPDNLFSQQEERWLGVQLQGQEEQARVLLVSVPYAMKAHEAETLGGLPASAFVKAPTGGAAGRISAYADGTAVNALGNVGKTPGTTQGKGPGGKPLAICTPVPGAFIFWDSQGSECPSNLTQVIGGAYNGNIGIKNANPSTALDVNGIINAWKWYDISKFELAFAGVGFQVGLGNLPDPTKRDTFVGVGAGTTNPPAPAATPLGETDNSFFGYYAGSNTKTSAAGTGVGNTFAGSQAGMSNVLGSQNTFMGWQAGFNNTVDANTFIGTQAGFSNVTGLQNTFTGWQAGFVNLANNNSFYGYRAGFHNSDGTGNSFFGLAAGFRNFSGSYSTYVGQDSGWTFDTPGYNTFTGFESGFNNTAKNGAFYGYKAGHENTADGNSFFGFSAGTANTSGNSNTFLGNLAGTVNTTGSGDTFVGDSAGAANVTNNNNTFTGQNAGKANTADGNSFYGYNAGLSNTTGQQNVFVGISAGSDNTTGGGNTYVGWEAGIHSAPGTGTCCNTFVGNGAGLGTSGSGTLSGGGNSFFGHRAGEATTTGGKNTYSGFWSGLVNQTGSFNSFYGDQSGQSMVAGDYNTFLGISAAGSTFTAGNFNIFVGAFAGDQENNVDNSIEIGNNGSNHYGNGSIQIGTMGTHVNKTYIAGFAPSTLPPNVYYDTTSGQLFATTGSSGGGIGGTCTAGFITQWLSPTMVGCSTIFQAANGFIGIGTLTPSKELDVNGVINAQKWYDIGSPETPVLTIGPTVTPADGNLFAGYQAGNNTDIPSGQDTYVGYQAGYTATGNFNTFSGYQAGYGNTGTPNTGGFNTFSGWQAGVANTSGSSNTFTGFGAGFENTAGSSNSYYGYFAGQRGSDPATSNNSYFGTATAFQNFSGGNNACFGAYSCYTNESGNKNTAIGTSAGQNLHGDTNIMVGYQAGLNDNSPSSSNIDIGNAGCTGSGCVESNIIRIGTDGSGDGQQNATYIAGIYNAPMLTEPVCINPAGKLARCSSSSLRFKDQIANMDDSSSKLFQLRPVTFFYKPRYDDGTRQLQFGLIAEEVARIYPEMAVYDKDGQPSGVKYQMLAPMLLNELQKEHAVVMTQQDQLQTQLQQIKVQRQEIDGLKLQLQQQNASLQDRLQRLESYVATQMKTASDTAQPTTVSANGGVQ